ncbi:MAG TPA: ABC transporter permease [Bryobacteraceae bacterium]|jgi:lipoprotein-releasing system permease protein|nr:ABC transporter permease [Bryobacteraceae bacterium]
MNTRSFEFFIASRYLRAKRKQAVISVITVISVFGVTAGVAALVIGIAINNGFRDTLQRSLLGATAHVMVLDKQGDGIANWRELDPKLHQLPHVVSVAPNLYGPVLLAGPLGGRQAGGAEIKGIPVDNPPDMLKHLKQGSFEKMKDTSGLPGIILGSGVAQKTGMLLGSIVNVISPEGIELTPFGPKMPQPTRFRVVGIFESGFGDLDSFFAFTSLPSAQKLFSVGDVVNSIELHLDDIYQAPEVAKMAKEITGPSMDANTWMEQYHSILDALATERKVTIVTIGLIGIVAALNILITLIMMVMEKNRDIAVLMSMGAKRQQIRRIFMLQGVLIGGVGTAIGLALGYSLSILADHYRWMRLSEDVYAVSYVPFNPRWQDAIWIAAAAILVSLIATLYPAKAATSIAPVEALRYE